MRQSRRWFLRGMALPNMAPGLRANGNLSIRSIKIFLLHTLWEASCAATLTPQSHVSPGGAHSPALRRRVSDVTPYNLSLL